MITRIIVLTFALLAGNVYLGFTLGRIVADIPHKGIKVGILVQKKFERNYLLKESLKNRINKVEAKDQELPRKVLAEHGIVLGKGETCRMNLKTGSLIFFNKN